MVQQLSASTAIPEGVNLDPRTQTGWLTSICNCSSREFDTHFGPSGALADTYVYTRELK